MREEDKLLTILIVTKDRVEDFKLCVRRLSILPWIDRVKIDIYDNSGNWNSTVKSGYLNSFYEMDYRFFHIEDFLYCRNKSVHNCGTPYFTILDDDDYFAVDAIPMILQAIEKFPHMEFFNFGASKEGRLDKWDSDEIILASEESKLVYLNDFNNYQEDRVNKVYLRNAGQVISKSLFDKSKVEWKYKGCDDILPITTMYLDADMTVRINRPLFYYSSQGTVEASKSKESKKKLEDNMIASYSELLDRYKDDLTSTLIIGKSIKNSINQLKVIDKYDAVNLKQLI